MYLDAKGNVVPDASVVGYRAIGVPGSVAGLVYAEKKFGKLTLAQVMTPAISLARQGFPLSAHLPARRPLLRGGRDLQAARAGADAPPPSRIAADPDSFYHGALAQELAASTSEERRAHLRRGVTHLGQSHPNVPAVSKP